ncbi:hypothetical protein TZ03_21430 [Pseudomonas sp. 10-1B]|nr:hypothetical protein TZ03_21430 [Pseudomonas sp. 10-1B]
MGAGVPANTGEAGASHRAGFFAGTPAPTEVASRIRIESLRDSAALQGWVISYRDVAMVKLFIPTCYQGHNQIIEINVPLFRKA